MTDTRARLINCLLAVFPALTPDTAASAGRGRTPDWDSMNQLSLIAVIEEEFAIVIDPAEMDRLVTFEDIVRYLDSNTN